MTHTLTLFNTGQVTLPKARRSQYSTKHFTATEVEGGLLIKPILEDQKETIFYENADGFGIYNDSGIDPDQIIASIKLLQSRG